jgi:hypothetical protein
MAERMWVSNRALSTMNTPPAACTPFPDTFGAEGLLPSRAIRDVLQKIRVKIRLVQSINERQKRSAEHGRVQNWLLIDLPPPRACYSCNTLLKRLGGSGDSSAFSLCRGFG